MNGKILKVSSNDLYGNADDREVIVYAAFNHIKYMNKYIIFAIKEEYAKKKLYYGSVHQKDDTLIIFSVNNKIKEYIDKFTDDYLNNNIDSKEYELIDISSYKKVELVSYSEEDFDKLQELEKISIKEEEVNTEETNKKPAILYIMLFISIALLIGITYLYLFPEKFTVELKQLDCDANLYNSKLDMSYYSTRNITFDNSEKVRKISVTDIYTFDDMTTYNEFKENNSESTYFSSLNGTYKYDDAKLELRIMYEETSIIEDYTEIKQYLKNEQYICTEGTYYE